MCVANRSLYVSADYGGLTVQNQTGGVFRRIDGGRPAWERVYRNYHPKYATWNQTGRGITAVPADDGSGSEVILVGVEDPPEAVIVRIEPRHGHRAVVEINYHDYLREAVFRREVLLNTGLRMEAAKWLASPLNTPREARVMVGYTGLGVIGAHCQRYVLDLGALINPDIFAYYQGAPATPQGRWERQVKYMRDHDMNYYVTFARPAEYRDKIADPGATPGFAEAVRLGTVGEVPASPYEQIRIYRIDWKEWRASRQRGAARRESPWKGTDAIPGGME
jgi:hypothetical protein